MEKSLNYNLIINLSDNSYPNDSVLYKEITQVLRKKFTIRNKPAGYTVYIQAYFIIPEITEVIKEKYLSSKRNNELVKAFLKHINHDFLRFYDSMHEIKRLSNYSLYKNNDTYQEIWQYTIKIQNSIENVKLYFDYKRMIETTCKYSYSNNDPTGAVIKLIPLGEPIILSPSQLTSTSININDTCNLYVNIDKKKLSKLLPSKINKIAKNTKIKDQKIEKETTSKLKKSLKTKPNNSK